jgi:hypothetical protein
MSIRMRSSIAVVVVVCSMLLLLASGMMSGKAYAASIATPDLKNASATSFMCGSTCAHKDPYVAYAGQSCVTGAHIANTATITDDQGVTLARIENWYSPLCNTHWARMQWSVSGTPLVRLEIYQTYLPTNNEFVPSGGNGIYRGVSPIWTHMISNNSQPTTAFGAISLDGINYYTNLSNA